MRRIAATQLAAYARLRPLSTKVVDKFVDFVLAARNMSLPLPAKSAAINF
ncbi:MAG TPA: hypothetical protein VEG36_03305 [Burkholderiales bacterium]|nr:hypothetical protein [Burkholderiales bacterium]